MGLFDWLFGKNPTDDWPATSSVGTLEYDFDKHTLAGVPIGSPLNAFRKLGRPEDAARARKGTLIWYTRGFELDSEQGHVMDFMFYWSDDWADPAGEPKPFAGRLRKGGADVRWTPQTTEAEITNVLGPPTNRKESEDYTKLTYERGNVTYEFELTEHGRLSEMLVIAEEPLTTAR